MNPHANWSIFPDIKFDIDLLVNIVTKGNFKFSDKRSQRIVLDNEEGFDLFLELLLVEQEVASRGVFSCDLGDSIQEF